MGRSKRDGSRRLAAGVTRRKLQGHRRCGIFKWFDGDRPRCRRALGGIHRTGGQADRTAHSGSAILAANWFHRRSAMGPTIFLAPKCKKPTDKCARAIGPVHTNAQWWARWLLVPKFHLGTPLWRPFHGRSPPVKQPKSARNEISRGQETLPSETWERGAPDARRLI